MHFEIAGPDGSVLQQFYHDLFGWKIDVQSEEMGNYGLASANERSIGGGVFPTTEDMPARSYVTFYVQVDDLQAALDKVVGMGGSVIIPPMEIAPGMGSIAMFGDPADNTIGVVNQRKWDSIGPEKVMVMKSGERALPPSPCGRMAWSSPLRSWAASALLTCDWDTLCSFHEVLYPRLGARSTPSISRVS